MSSCGSLLRSRVRVSARTISSALSPCKKSVQSEVSSSLMSPSSSRISGISRLALGSGCLLSMMPLHSAIAAARLTSVLAAESQSWGRIPQGNSMPL